MIKQEKWVFIVNPTAGGGFGKSVGSVNWSDSCQHRSLDASMVLTESHGHATRIAAEYLEKGYYPFHCSGRGWNHERGC